jgi:CRISPR-associated protein Csb1
MADSLKYEDLRDAVAGTAAAVRSTVRLVPAAGRGTKAFPPTHSGGVYAWEMRRIGKDEVVPTVLLDSVQSQANRMEQALKQAFPVDEESKPPKCRIPVVRVDFNKHFPDIGYVTTFDAPHRIADAILRDSLLNGTKFRESDVGRAFVQSTIRDATGLFRYCPHALVFGIWDSTGSAGGLGNKFQRAITSEIVGIQAEKGVHTSSRIDPLGITKAAQIYRTPEGGWTLKKDEAARNAKGEPVTAKPSDFLHSNIPPTIDWDERTKEPLRGGVTIDYAEQTVVLSLPALRRLRFPDDQGKEASERNDTARTVLAALALAAVAHQREQGYDLRSRCLLIPEGLAAFELIANDGKVDTYGLTATQADVLLKDAINAAKAKGLLWEESTITLKPEERLVELVRKSRESTTAREG